MKKMLEIGDKMHKRKNRSNFIIKARLVQRLAGWLPKSGLSFAVIKLIHAHAFFYSSRNAIVNR